MASSTRIPSLGGSRKLPGPAAHYRIHPRAPLSPPPLGFGSRSTFRLTPISAIRVPPSLHHPVQIPEASRPAAAAAHGPKHAPPTAGRCSRRMPPASASISAAGSSGSGDWQRPAAVGTHASLSPRLILLCLMVLVFGVSNRVLYRIALVPMREYVFFLAQFQNVVYLLVYFSILLIRYRAKLVTPEMLALPKGPMVIIGGCEAASQLLFMIGASHLPGVLLPMVNQTYLVWNLTFASLLLGMRYTRAQILGALMVVAGVVTAAAPVRFFPWWQPAVSSVSGQLVEAVDVKYVAICIVCFAFPALNSIIKEKLFYTAGKHLGQHLDIFIVNSFASLYQALFVLLMLPVALSYNHISLQGLPEYLQQGAACFQGLAPTCGAPACDGAPILPILYVGTNLIFNISILTMIRTVGSVSTTILGSCLVPLTMLCFTLPLPYLEQATLQPNLVLGASVLLLGLFIYNLGSLRTPPAVASADDLHQP